MQSWFASVQRELWTGALLDLAYVGNRADGLLLFANFNQAAPNNAAGTLSLQSRRPIPEFADITYSFNGGKSRYHAFQAKFDWRIGCEHDAAQLADAVADQGQRRRLARERRTATSRRRRTSTTSTRTTACRRYHQPYNSTTSFVVDLPFGRGRRYMSGAIGAGRRAARRLADRRHQHRRRRRDGDADLHADARRSRCRASSRTSAAPTTIGPTSSAIRCVPEGERNDQQLVEPRQR